MGGVGSAERGELRRLGPFPCFANRHRRTAWRAHRPSAARRAVFGPLRFAPHALCRAVAGAGHVAESLRRSERAVVEFTVPGPSPAQALGVLSRPEEAAGAFVPVRVPPPAPAYRLLLHNGVVVAVPSTPRVPGHLPTSTLALFVFTPPSNQMVGYCTAFPPLTGPQRTPRRTRTASPARSPSGCRSPSPCAGVLGTNLLRTLAAVHLGVSADHRSWLHPAHTPTVSIVVASLDAASAAIMSWLLREFLHVGVEGRSRESRGLQHCFTGCFGDR